ncbi:hypothetical protein [Leekyejoonella antrihumi]|uniref:Uncharacterized protein n=1 Tax=Leekyejoonella antrihumi TaxID=1660198 RepID=A0A563DUE7_9MICO|nr:hypothetical protein [Leekyejoonella antrihumi]TWP33542.1 hypothetical protein FGL98_21075 [Leekyejoonella antrihumi]
MTTITEHSPGVQGARSGPLASSGQRSERSEVSDTATACPVVDAIHTPSQGASDDPGVEKPCRRGRSKIDTRFDEATFEAVRTRAARLGLRPSTWLKQVARDALDKRRTDEVDAAVGSALLQIEARVQVSADARRLAAQVRPLAINVNDLDARARAGQPVTLSPDVPELIGLLREVRELLGDRVAS